MIATRRVYRPFERRMSSSRDARADCAASTREVMSRSRCHCSSEIPSSSER